jgi:hypothetical protein
MSAEKRVKELERANEELRRANVALARERHGASDTAAAGLLLRLSEAEAELAQVESSVSWRITAPLRWVKNLVLSLVRAIRPKRPPGPE